MATISITNQTLTLTIVIDSVSYVIRKDNAKVIAYGDYVRITDYTGERYEFLYTDVVSPSEASANDLRDAIEEFLNTAGGGGGGGTVDTITSDSLTVDSTDPANPTINLPYLVYTALITQSGTSAPTATVLQNTFGGIIVWTRNDVGDYTGTLTGAFTTNKTWCSLSGQIGTSGLVQVISPDVDSILIGSFVINYDDLATQTSDDIIQKGTLEIRVYP